MVLQGISNNQQSWLGVLGLDIVGECTWGETTSNGLDTSVTSELENGTLGIWGSCSLNCDDANIGGVLNGNNNTGSEDKLLPGLADVNNVESILTSFVDILLHSCGAVACTEVDLASEEHLDILSRELEGCGKLTHDLIVV
jgi:hypothetical protein